MVFEEGIKVLSSYIFVGSYLDFEVTSSVFFFLILGDCVSWFV